MGKVQIGSTIFATPVNSAYNTIYSGYAYRHHSHQLLQIEFAFIGLRECPAVNNAKMAMYPTLCRALEVDE